MPHDSKRDRKMPMVSAVNAKSVVVWCFVVFARRHTFVIIMVVGLLSVCCCCNAPYVAGVFNICVLVSHSTGSALTVPHSGHQRR